MRIAVSEAEPREESAFAALSATNASELLAERLDGRHVPGGGTVV